MCARVRPSAHRYRRRPTRPTGFRSLHPRTDFPSRTNVFILYTTPRFIDTNSSSIYRFHTYIYIYIFSCYCHYIPIPPYTATDSPPSLSIRIYIFIPPTYRVHFIYYVYVILYIIYVFFCSILV